MWDRENSFRNRGFHFKGFFLQGQSRRKQGYYHHALEKFQRGLSAEPAAGKGEGEGWREGERDFLAFGSKFLQWTAEREREEGRGSSDLE